MEYSNFFARACSFAVQSGGAAIFRALYGRTFTGGSRGPGRASAQTRGFGHGGLGGEALTGGIGSTMAAAMILLVQPQGQAS